MPRPYANRRDFLAGAALSAASSLAAGQLVSTPAARPTLTVSVPEDLEQYLAMVAALVDWAGLPWTIRAAPQGSTSLDQSKGLVQGADVSIVDVVFAESGALASFAPLDLGAVDAAAFEDVCLRTCPQDPDGTPARLCLPFSVNVGALLHRSPARADAPPRPSLATMLLGDDPALRWAAPLGRPDQDASERTFCSMLEHVAVAVPSLVDPATHRITFDDAGAWQDAADVLREAIAAGRLVADSVDENTVFKRWRRDPDLAAVRIWTKDFAARRLSSTCPAATLVQMADADPTGVLGGYDIGVHRSSRHRGHAEDLVRTLLGDPFQTLLMGFGHVPASGTALSADPVSPDVTRAGFVRDALNDCVLRPRALDYATYRTLMKTLTTAVLSPDGDVVEAVGRVREAETVVGAASDPEGQA